MIGDAIFALSLELSRSRRAAAAGRWGSLLESGLNLIALDPWWLILPPGMAVFISLLAASLTGQGLFRRWGGR